MQTSLAVVEVADGGVGQVNGLGACKAVQMEMAIQYLMVNFHQMAVKQLIQLPAANRKPI